MMGSLVPWRNRVVEPADEFRREMNTLMNWFDRRFDGLEGVQDFSPHVNVAETDKGYHVTAELPGMKPDDINIELKQGELWLSGERRCECEKEDPGKTYHLTESRYGQFRRVIRLGDEVDPDKIDAEYKDGILSIQLLKTKSSSTKRIKVHASSKS